MDPTSTPSTTYHLLQQRVTLPYGSTMIFSGSLGYLSKPQSVAVNGNMCQLKCSLDFPG